MMKEKANVQSAAPRKVKGTVLFTVVCVMMVLIVFLMGTLALASTANKRAQTNYQKEQSEYTARAVLDAVVDVINQDTDGTGLKGAIAEDKITSVPVTMDGQNYTVNIEKQSDPRSIYVSEADGWKDIPVYAVSVDIASNTTAAETVYTAFLTAKVETTGGGGGGGGGGGAFVSMGQVQENIGTGGYITGGTYIGVSNTKVPIASMPTFKISGSGYTVIDAPMYLNGSFKPGTSAVMDIHFSSADQFMAIMGDFEPEEEFYTQFGSWDTLGTGTYEQVPAIYVGGELRTNSNNAGLHIGNDDIPVNVFAGQFTIMDPNKKGGGIHGDLYGFNPNVKNTIRAADDATDLYKWTKNTVTRTGSTTPETFGNIYSEGDLEIASGSGTLDIGGDIRASKDVTINAATKVNGNVYVGGTLTINADLDVSGHIYAQAIQKNSGNVNSAGNHAFSANGVPLSETYAGGAVIGSRTITYTLKNDEGYTNGIRMTYNGDNMTMEQAYSYSQVSVINGVTTTDPQQDYYNSVTSSKWNIGFGDAWKYSTQDCVETYGAWNDYNVARVKLDAIATNSVVTESVLDNNLESKVGKIYPDQYKLANMPNAVFTEPTAATYTTGYITKADDLDKSLYDSSKTPQYQIPVYSNNTAPDGSDAFADGMLTISNNCVLSGTMNKGNIYIKPAGSAITVILDNLTMDQNGGAGKVMLIVDDSSQVTFFVRGTTSLSGGLYTTDYLNLLTGKNPLSTTGALTSDQLKAMRADFSITASLTIPQQVDTTKADESIYLPNVIIYGDQGSTLKIPDGDKQAVTAQIRAPEMTFYQRMGRSSAGITYKLPNGTTIDYDGTKTKFLGVIGQLIAKNIAADGAESWGMLYVTEADKRCAYCKAHGCTACTGDSSCTCTCTGCTCHGGGGGGGGSKYVNAYNVLYYNIY